jgi:Uma2 family endonuclease
MGRELSQQLKNRPCEAYLSDMRVKVTETRSHHYPDRAVLCGTPQFEDDKVDTLLNPTLLIEVLSPSTVKWTPSQDKSESNLRG